MPSSWLYRRARVVAPILAIAAALVVTWQPSTSGEDPAASAATTPDSVVPPAAGEVVLPAAPVTATCAPVDESSGCRVVPVAASGVGAGPPVVGEGLLLLVEGAEVRGVELATGHERWSVDPFDGVLVRSITAEQGLLLVAAPGRLARLDPATGSTAWERAFPTGSTTPPRAWAFAAGILVLDGAGTLLSLDPSDGAMRWVREDVQLEVQRTSEGLMVRTGTQLGLWSPASPMPRWLRADTVGHALELPPGSILGLLSDPGRIDVETGDRILRTPGSAVLAGHLPPGVDRVELRWVPAGDRATATATDRAGVPLWTSEPLDLSCCSLAGVPAGELRLALAAPDGLGVLLDAASGTLLAVTAHPGAQLVGVVADRAVWRTEQGIVVLRLGDGEVLLESGGQLRSLDPLVLEGAGGLVHVLWETDDGATR